MTPEQIAALQQQLAAAQRDLAFARAGITNPDDAALASFYYDRLPPENRPTHDAWIADGKAKGTLPRALASLFTAPAATTPAPTTPAPTTPAATTPAATTPAATAPATTPNPAANTTPATPAPTTPAAVTQPTATPTASPAPTAPALSAQEIRRMTAEAARSGDWSKVQARHAEINQAAGVAPPEPLTAQPAAAK